LTNSERIFISPLETLEILLELGVWVEVSTPLIPGVNTAGGELEKIAKALAGLQVDIPWHLVRFVPEHRMSGLSPTAPETLRRAIQIGRDAGLRFIYTERLLDEAGRQTLCPHCRSPLVERRLYGLVEDRTRNGQCPNCGASLPCVWR